MQRRLPTHEIEYARRMNAVLDHIDRHLDQPLDLATLAEVAHFSAYHFHRLFAAWTGETLGEYLRRRRLEWGALQLVMQPRLAVTTIALTVGFGSGEAFARAFKSHFGATPTAWRAGEAARRASYFAAIGERRRLPDRNPDQVQSKCDQSGGKAFTDDGGVCSHRKETIMDVKVIDLPPVRVAYLRYTGPYGLGIGHFWVNEFDPWMISNGLENRTCYGVGLDDPSITPPDKCRYDACVEVADDFVPSGKASVTVIPGGRHAVASFEGSGAQMADAWAELFRDWLPASGLQCDARPCFERYGPNAASGTVPRQLRCELCIPIRPM